MSIDALHVEIEATNLCNTKCLHCPHKAISRVSGKMDLPTFQVIADKIKNKKADFSIEFSGMGEPLLNPLIYDFIKYVSNQGETSLTTNGAALTPKNTQRLINSGLKRLTISFNGADKAVYENMMGGLSFEKAEKNLQNAVDMSKGSSTEVCANVCVTKQTQNHFAEIINYLREEGIKTIYLAMCHNRGGFLKGDVVCSTPMPPSDAYRCDIFKSTMFISWTGEVLSCCHDLDGDNVMGNLLDEEIETILSRKTNIVNKGVKFDICRECNDLQRFMKDRTPDGRPLFDWIYSLFVDEDKPNFAEDSSLSKWIYSLYVKEEKAEKFTKTLAVQLLKKEQTVHFLNTQVQEKDQAVKTLNKVYAKEIGKQKAKLEESEREREAQILVLQGIYNSHSWYLIKIIKGVKGFFQKMLKSFNRTKK